jgi:hypothetical protein
MGLFERNIHEVMRPLSICSQMFVFYHQNQIGALHAFFIDF